MADVKCLLLDGGWSWLFGRQPVTGPDVLWILGIEDRVVLQLVIGEAMLLKIPPVPLHQIEARKDEKSGSPWKPDASHL